MTLFSLRRLGFEENAKKKELPPCFSVAKPNYFDRAERTHSEVESSGHGAKRVVEKSGLNPRECHRTQLSAIRIDIALIRGFGRS